MYAIHHQPVEVLWQRLRDELRLQGMANLPVHLDWPDPLVPYWRNPRLLLSQTCGYPLVTALPAVQVVGRFHYAAPGCEGSDYRSLLLVRENDRRRTLADFRQSVVACNSLDSHSGYNVLRYMISPLAERGRFFQRVVFTGAHSHSLDAVRDGLADLTSVDCVIFELVNRARPHALKGLRVLCETPSAPGLPLITAAATPHRVVLQLRSALAALVEGPAGAQACSSLLITGFSPAEREDYQIILQMRLMAEQREVMTL